MKTSEEILERFLSAESADFFTAQRSVLMGALPYEMAKPHLDQSYVQQIEDGTLPDEEKWEENFVAKEQILELIPILYKALQTGNGAIVAEGLLYMKACVWMDDDKLYSEIEPMYQEDNLDLGKSIIDKIATHYGHKPSIEDVAFEEIPAEESKDD